jgi:hypothetical protein
MMELSYPRHRFPPVVIQHAVWLYLRFTSVPGLRKGGVNPFPGVGTLTEATRAVSKR